MPRSVMLCALSLLPSGTEEHAAQAQSMGVSGPGLLQSCCWPLHLRPLALGALKSNGEKDCSYEKGNTPHAAPSCVARTVQCWHSCALHTSSISKGSGHAVNSFELPPDNKETKCSGLY